jgi:hypothetical protein
MRESVIDSESTRGGDFFSGAIGGKNMASPLRGLAQAVRDWAISVVASSTVAKQIMRSRIAGAIPKRDTPAGSSRICEGMKGSGGDKITGLKAGSSATASSRTR